MGSPTDGAFESGAALANTLQRSGGYCAFPLLNTDTPTFPKEVREHWQPAHIMPRFGDTLALTLHRFGDTFWNPPSVFVSRESLDFRFLSSLGSGPLSGVVQQSFCAGRNSHPDILLLDVAPDRFHNDPGEIRLSRSGSEDEPM